MARRVPIDRELLDALARLLHAHGIPPAQLQRTFTEICRQLKSQPVPAKNTHPLPVLAQFIAEWHRNPRYLDTHGAPRPLPARGARSLTTLSREVHPQTDPRTALAALKSNRAITSTPKGYLPTGRRIVFAGDDARAHGLTVVGDLLRTLSRNLSADRRTLRLFECTATHAAVPENQLARLDAQVRPSAVDWLWRSHGVLTRLSRTPSRAGRVRMGVSVFVFADPSSTPPAPRRRKAPR
jgi:hypothetical protein